MVAQKYVSENVIFCERTKVVSRNGILMFDATQSAI
jgi:hypothetical protein